MRGMRVLQLMAGAEFGGGEMQFVDTAAALHEAGIEQLVVTRPNRLRVERLKATGVPHELISFASFPPLATRFAVHRLVRRFRPDVVQAWMGRAATFATTRKAVRVGWFGGYHDLKRFRHLDYFVAISKDIVRHIAQAGVPEQQIRLIHQFSDIQDAQAVDRTEFGTPAGAPLLLALARLHPRKALDVLIKAVSGLPGVHLWIAGEGELRGELITLIQQLGLTDRVKLLGWRTDSAALLKAADVFVIPSRSEPFGIVMLEAWAMRRPIVAAASEGPRGYIRNEDTGLLCEIDDVEGLRGVIARCLADEALRRHLTESGVAEYQAHFTKEVMVRGYRSFYGEIVAARRGEG